jgi:hypothetical protein
VEKGEEIMSDHWDKYYDDVANAAKLPQQRTIPTMPPVKQLRDEACEDCAKADVCSMQEDFMKAYKDILEIEGRTNVFINTSVKCKKFLRKLSVSNTR